MHNPYVSPSKSMLFLYAVCRLCVASLFPNVVKHAYVRVLDTTL